MEYDFRNRVGPQYDSQIPMYRQTPTSSSSSSSHRPAYGAQPSLYPKIGQPGGPPARPPPYFHHQNSPNTSSSSSGIGIRVYLKPEYRITPPPPLSPQIGDIPRSTFQFDFDFERKILAEAEKESPNWSRLVENLPSKMAESPSSLSSREDPVVSKYIALGLSREAVPLAVANYGDNQVKVKEFVNGYTLLRDMGFPSNSVAEALLVNENDNEKALTQLLNS